MGTINTTSIFYPEENISNRGKLITKTASGEPLSYQYDECWDFIGEQRVGVGKGTKVSFQRIKNPIHRKSIQDVVYKYYFYKGGASVRSLQHMASGLLAVSEIIEGTNWSVLDQQSGWNRLKRSIKGRYTHATLESKLAVINKLGQIGIIKRQSSMNEFRELTRVDGGTQQHIAIPPFFYQKLLIHCVETVETYHAYRHEISRVMSEALDIRKRAHNGEIFSLYHVKNNIIPSVGNLQIDKRIRRRCKKIAHAIPDFQIVFNGRWIGSILTECFVVCAIFSGARIGEILSFDKDSYQTIETIDGEFSYLSGATTKGNRGEEREEVWQTHPIVKDALELAYDMTEFSRSEQMVQLDKLRANGSISSDKYQKFIKELRSAFISCRVSGAIKESYVLSSPERYTNQLLKRLGLKASFSDVEEFDLLNPSRLGQLKEGKSLPKLTPHDFRRSFAVFIKRYGFGNDLTIKYQYKHSNINMSGYYAKNAKLAQLNDVILDKELVDMMEEEGIRMGVEAYDEIFNQSEHLSGLEGERITKDKIERLQSGQKMYMNLEEIEELVRSKSISIVMLPTGGYCTNSDCERLCSLDNFIPEKYECPYMILTDKVAKKIAKRRIDRINTFRALNNGDPTMNHILSGYKQKIIQMELTLDKHDIPYDPFVDLIEGCYVA